MNKSKFGAFVSHLDNDTERELYHLRGDLGQVRRRMDAFIHASADELVAREGVWDLLLPLVAQFTERAQSLHFAKSKGWTNVRRENFDTLAPFTLLEYQDIGLFGGSPDSSSTINQTAGLFGHVYMGIHRGVFFGCANGYARLIPANGYNPEALRRMDAEKAFNCAVLMNVGEELPTDAPSHLAIIRVKDYRYGAKLTVLHLDQTWVVKSTAMLRKLDCVFTDEGKHALVAEVECHEAAMRHVREDAMHVQGHSGPQCAVPTASDIKDVMALTDKHGSCIFMKSSLLRESSYCTSVKGQNLAPTPDFYSDSTATVIGAHGSDDGVEGTGSVNPVSLSAGPGAYTSLARVFDRSKLDDVPDHDNAPSIPKVMQGAKGLDAAVLEQESRVAEERAAVELLPEARLNNASAVRKNYGWVAS